MTSEHSGQGPIALRMALQYDTRVFPVEYTAEGGKKRTHPLVRQYHDHASKDPAQIEQWWDDHPDAAIGGVPDPGIVILDVDPRDGGADLLRALVDEGVIERPITTRRHVSGGRDRGSHIWWRWPLDRLPSVRGLKRWAVDHGVIAPDADTCGIDLITHRHRFTYLPGTVHPMTGEAYAWAVDGEIEEMPIRLVELLDPGVRPEPKAPTPSSSVDWSQYVERSPLDAFKEDHSIAEILLAHGWERVDHRDELDDRPGDAWLHPNNPTGTQSATIGPDGRLYVYSPRAGLPDQTEGENGVLGLSVIDVIAHLEHGGDTSRAIEEATAQARAEDPTLGDMASSWSPVDLTDALAGRARVRPGYLRRPDGAGCVYAGKLNWFFGEPESLKTFGAIVAASQALQNGERVLMIDYENSEYDIVERLLGLGVEPDRIEALFSYVQPEVSAQSAPDRVAALIEMRPALVVLDGVTASSAIEGLDPNTGAEVAQWLQRITRRFAAVGSAVIVIDHVVKSLEARGRWMVGSQHKMAALDGVAMEFRLRKPLALSTGEPVTGEAMMIVRKDRPGGVRAHCSSVEGMHAFGNLKLTNRLKNGSLDEQQTEAEIDPDVTGFSGAPEEFTRRIAGALERYAGMTGASASQLRDVVESDQSLMPLLDRMITQGWVRVDADGATPRYWLTVEGSEAIFDDA